MTKLFIGVGILLQQGCCEVMLHHVGQKLAISANIGSPLGRLNLAQSCHKFPAKLLEGGGTAPSHNGLYKRRPNYFTIIIYLFFHRIIICYHYHPR